MLSEKHLKMILAELGEQPEPQPNSAVFVLPEIPQTEPEPPKPSEPSYNDIIENHFNNIFIN